MKNDFMNEALLQAKIAFEKDEVPVGAVLVENGKIIAKAFNQNITLKDPTAHAEILVLREAAKLKNSHRLENCDLYVTVEPCAMCAAAISWARIKRVYFGVADEKFGAIENGARLFSQTSNYHKPEIYSGFCADESKQLMQNFFRKKR
jgi:tRNA(adenine34) deaminase